MSDGDSVIAHLDRNGLRPMRYSVTEEGVLILGSEAGMIDLEGRVISKKDRMVPGGTLIVDLAKGEIRHTEEIICDLADRKPYREWTDRYLVELQGRGKDNPRIPSDLVGKQKAFGYTYEEVDFSLKGMAMKAKEPTYSMGDDTPLPALAATPQLLFRYFKQRFSQVTNPPIDSMRERMVMSLRMNIGYKKNFLRETPAHAKRLRLESPVLLEAGMNEIEDQKVFKTMKIPITFQKAASDRLLKKAISELQSKVIDAARSGAEIIILSDMDISQERPAIPCLLAAAASFKALQQAGIATGQAL